MPYLAEASINPLDLGQLLILLGAAAAIYLKLRSALREMAGKGEAREIANDPLNVREAPEFVTRRECGILHHSLELRMTNLETRFERHSTDVKDTTDKLREDVADLSDRISDRFLNQAETLRAIERAVGRLES